LKTKVIKYPGKKAVKFKVGGLHQSLGVPTSEKIPAKLMSKALSGKAGPLAKKQANFAKNYLTGGRKK
jgi:hypothetical protein